MVGLLQRVPSWLVPALVGRTPPPTTAPGTPFLLHRPLSLAQMSTVLVAPLSYEYCAQLSRAFARRAVALSASSLLNLLYGPAVPQTAVRVSRSYRRAHIWLPSSCDWTPVRRCGASFPCLRWPLLLPPGCPSFLYRFRVGHDAVRSSQFHQRHCQQLPQLPWGFPGWFPRYERQILDPFPHFLYHIFRT